MRVEDNDIPRSMMRVTEDPLELIPTGGEVHLNASLFPLGYKGGLSWLKNWNHFQGSILAIMFGGADGFRITGSGVLVAPGVAISARHVLEPQFEYLKEGGVVSCMGLFGDQCSFWRVHQITLIEKSDLCVMTMTAASELPDPIVYTRITTRTPKLGERLTIIGFRNSLSIKGYNVSKSDVDMNLLISSGEVEEVYFNGRDNFMHPWTTYQVGCSMVGGVSGGAVFDEDGYLIGILSSSMQTEKNDGPSYVSPIWPCLGQRMDVPWPPNLFKKRISIFEMTRPYSFIEDYNSTKIDYNEASDAHTLMYQRWEERPGG